MEALKEIGFIALILIAVYLLANLIIHLYWKRRLRQYDKASADYQREVEEHQAKMRENEILSDGLSGALNRLKSPIRKSYSPKGKDADRSEDFTNSTHPVILGQEYPYWKEHTPDPISNEEKSIIDYQSQFDGAGHGGSFGGGGASGSWGSDDNSSSSSYDSSSSDSGGSDSSYSD